MCTAERAAPAFAQAYPNRFIKVVAPFAAGGTTGIVARTVASKMPQCIGQIVEADGIIIDWSRRRLDPNCGGSLSGDR